MRTDVELPSHLNLSGPGSQGLGDHKYYHYPSESDNESEEGSDTQQPVFNEEVVVLGSESFMTNDSELVNEVVVEETEESEDDEMNKDEVNVALS